MYFEVINFYFKTILGKNDTVKKKMLNFGSF